VFIGAMPAKYLNHGWAGVADGFAHTIHGPYVIMATVAGLGWLAWFLYIDAAVSPSGTGFIYTGTQARLLYGMGRQGYLPPATQKLNKNSVPWISVLIGWAGSVLLFLPFPSWSSLVAAITSVAVISYCAGPAALNHFRKVDPDRERGFKVPGSKVLGPLGFIFGSLLVYWTGWGTMWRVDGAIILGLIVMFVYLLIRPKDKRPPLDAKNSLWIWVWLIGLNLFALFGAFNGWPNDPTPEQLDSWYHPVNGLLSFGPDTIFVAVFGLLIYFWAQASALPAEKSLAYIAEDAEEASAASIQDEPAATAS
jgi:amino acid transporter